MSYFTHQQIGWVLVCVLYSVPQVPLKFGEPEVAPVAAHDFVQSKTLSRPSPPQLSRAWLSDSQVAVLVLLHEGKQRSFSAVPLEPLPSRSSQDALFIMSAQDWLTRTARAVSRQLPTVPEPPHFVT